MYKYSEPNSFRVILVDQVKDGISKGLWNEIKDRVHLYIHAPHYQFGYAKAMNEGIIHALHWGTPLICPSNDDIEIINSRWMDGIHKTFELDKRIMGVVPMSPRIPGWGYGLKINPDIIPYKEEYTEEDYDYLLNGDFSDAKLPETFPQNMKGNIIDGSIFIMPYFKRELFEEIGLLDERYWPGCFLPGTKVMTDNYKYKNIEDISNKDNVISHLGNSCFVEANNKKHYEGEILEISLTGTTEKIRLTPDHKVFAVSKTGKRGKRSVGWFRKKKKIIEVEAKDLLPKDLLYFPVVKKDNPNYYTTSTTSTTTLPYTTFTSTYADMSKEAFRVYGYFLAEGHYIKKNLKSGKKRTGIAFTFHIKERNYVKEVYKYFTNMGISCSVYDRPSKTISVVEVYNHDVAEKFYSLFGEYSWGKSISPKIMKADNHLLKELVIGYSNGDGGMCKEFKKGHSKKDYAQLKIKSVSSQLLTDVRNILLKLGIPSLLYIKTKTNKRARRPAHELYISQNYLNRLYDLPEEKRDKAPRNEVFEEKGKIYYPIKKIVKKKYKGPVYDLQVIGDHSYIVNTVAVHNSGEDMDFMARSYQKNYRIVSTSYSWIWHHLTKSKDLFASGELENDYYKPPHKKYWNNESEIWPEGFDAWGYKEVDGEKVFYKRVPEIYTDIPQ